MNYAIRYRNLTCKLRHTLTHFAVRIIWYIYLSVSVGIVDMELVMFIAASNL